LEVADIGEELFPEGLKGCTVVHVLCRTREKGGEVDVEGMYVLQCVQAGVLNDMR
jgi:hypothetical protein